MIIHKIPVATKLRICLATMNRAIDISDVENNSLFLLARATFIGELLRQALKASVQHGEA